MNEFMSSIPSSKFSLAYTGQVRREEGPLNTGVLLVKLGWCVHMSFKNPWWSWVLENADTIMNDGFKMVLTNRNQGICYHVTDKWRFTDYEIGTYTTQFLWHLMNELVQWDGIGVLLMAHMSSFKDVDWCELCGDLNHDSHGFYQHLWHTHTLIYIYNSW